MAASSGYATIHRSDEADKNTSYVFNRDGVRLEVAKYEFPRKILVNSSTQNVKYNWSRTGANYLISDNREDTEPTDGEVQYLEIGRIVSGAEPGRYLFRKMKPSPAEKKGWRRGSTFLKDTRALPVFVKCSKFLPLQARTVVGYQRNANTGLLDLAAVDIDNVFFYGEILTREMLLSPVHDRIKEAAAKVREFAAENKMQDPKSVPKAAIIKSPTKSTSMSSEVSVSELDHVVDIDREMPDAFEDNEPDNTPPQDIHSVVRQRLLIADQASMIAKFVDDDTEFSLENATDLQQELKSQSPESSPIDISFTQALHAAIHKKELGKAISTRDVVRFLEIAHTLAEEAEMSADDDAFVPTIARLAATIVAKISKVDSWTSPQLKEHGSDTAHAIIQYLYNRLTGIHARMENAAQELEKKLAREFETDGAFAKIALQLTEPSDQELLLKFFSEEIAVHPMKTAHAHNTAVIRDLLQVLEMMMKKKN